MKIRTAKIRATILLFLFILSTAPVRADQLRQRALANPLDCALFLAEHDENQRMSDHLYRAFFDAKRFDDTVRAIGNDMLWLNHFAGQLIDAGDRINAGKFLDRAMDILPEEDWWNGQLSDLAKVLARLGRDGDIETMLSHQDSDEGRASVTKGAMSGYAKAGDKEKTIRYGQLWRDFSDPAQDGTRDYFLADSYLQVRAVDQALAVVKRAEAEGAVMADSGLRDERFTLLIPLYFRLGNEEKAWELWHRISDQNSYKRLAFAKDLAAAGKANEARALLQESEADPQFLSNEGDDIVAVYLTLNDVDNARRVAEEMSRADDDYDQQRAFISVADRYLADGDSRTALDVLDLAVKKARKVEETHRPEDSNGASPLTRKIGYLWQIVDRYCKMGRYERAFSSIYSFKTNHKFGCKFMALSLISLAEKQIKLASRRSLLALLEKAEGIAREKDLAGYYDGELGMVLAGAYAKLGEPDRAQALMIKIIKAQFDDSYSPFDELVDAGSIFEENHLRANAEMRKLLNRILVDADD